MDAVKFLKEYHRMCKTVKGCDECPALCAHLKEGVGCLSWMSRFPEQSIPIVEKWSAENPIKTFMDDFFEKFPKAQKRSDGLPSTCPFALGYCEDSRCPSVGKDFVSNCLKCWSRPLEE